MPPRFILRDSLDHQNLEKLYVKDGLTMVQIGKRFGVSATAVCRLLDEYDIPRRRTPPSGTVAGVSADSTRRTQLFPKEDNND